MKSKYFSFGSSTDNGNFNKEATDFKNQFGGGRIMPVTQNIYKWRKNEFHNISNNL